MTQEPGMEKITLGGDARIWQSPAQCPDPLDFTGSRCEYLEHDSYSNQAKIFFIGLGYGLSHRNGPRDVQTLFRQGVRLHAQSGHEYPRYKNSTASLIYLTP